jgi:hypothetical protein
MYMSTGTRVGTTKRRLGLFQRDIYPERSCRRNPTSVLALNLLFIARLRFLSCNNSNFVLWFPRIKILPIQLTEHISRLNIPCILCRRPFRRCLDLDARLHFTPPSSIVNRSLLAWQFRALFHWWHYYRIICCVINTFIIYNFQLSFVSIHSFWFKCFSNLVSCSFTFLFCFIVFLLVQCFDSCIIYIFHYD